MKIAVVGSGISGLSAAYYLAKHHDVTVYEANNYLGGHTDTHNIDIIGQQCQVDSGFIVFNEENYINFTRFLSELGVESQPTQMSFSVQNVLSGLEYNATDLNRLFCQRRNLINPSFYRMIGDIIRFYREAPSVLADEHNTSTLGEYLEQGAYSRTFIDDHLLPMACALWSGPVSSIESFPLRYFVAFMHNHRMLSLNKRPQWRVVKGGSRSYVDAVLSQSKAKFVTGSPVQRLRHTSSGVELNVNGEVLTFDQVVVATHSDQALRMLEKPSQAEIQVLGAIQYQSNDMLLHADETILPKNRKAWASWNVRVSPELMHQCTVSYHMNTLQSLDAPVEFIVSLNSNHLVDSNKVFVSRNYMHPVYTEATINAQQRWAEISGVNRIHYCGAYWGWGFHEDGISSALKVVEAIEAVHAD
jgi:predicted NAD/FAD-binding protein